MNAYAPLLAGLLALLAGLAIGKAWERYKLRDGKWFDRRRESPHYILGLNFLVGNQIDLAVEELTRAASLDPDALEVHMILGNLYREKGQVGKAITIHQGLLQRPKLTRLEHAHVVLCLGLDYKRGGFVDRALDAFNEVMRLDPKNEYALVNLQKLHEEQHEWIEAYDTRRRLSKLTAPESSQNQAILAFLENEIGLEAMRRKDYVEAVRHFDAAIDLDARAVPAYLNLGDVRVAQGRDGDAAAVWDRMIEIAPDRAYLAFDRLEALAVRAGSPERFTRVCRRLIEENPQDWRARLALSHHFAASGRPHDALDLQFAALVQNPHALSIHQAIWRALAQLQYPASLVDRYSELTRHAVFYLDPHVCIRCRYRSTELLWQCPHCHDWNTFVEERIAPALDPMEVNLEPDSWIFGYPHGTIAAVRWSLAPPNRVDSGALVGVSGNAFKSKRGLLVVAAAAALSAVVACERRAPTGGAATATGDIVIGMYGSLTGDGASFGQSSRDGTEMAVEEINRSGGLLGGRKLKLLIEDDQSKPEDAASAVTKLITQDKVVALLGEVASRRSLAAAPVAQRYAIPMITPASTNERVTEVGDYIFRVCFIDPFQGEVLAKFAFNDLKAKKVAILKDIQQDYSVGLTDAISRTFKALGGEVLDPVSYSSGDGDFRAILTQIRGQKPDVVFVTGYYPEAAIIVRQARELGMNMPLLGGDGWVGDSLKNGREALNNSYISNHYSGDNPDPVVQNFVRDYRAKYHHEPDAMAALAYDAVKVLANSMTRAQSTEGPKVRDALAHADVNGVTGRLKVNAKRNMDKPAVIQAVTFADGDVKFVYKATVNP